MPRRLFGFKNNGQCYGLDETLAFEPCFLKLRPPSAADAADKVLPKLLSLANGDGMSGVRLRDSEAGRFCVLVPAPAPTFLRLLSEAFDAVLAFLLTPPSSISAVGVGLRDDVPDMLPLRTLLLRVRLWSRSMAVCRG